MKETVWKAALVCWGGLAIFIIFNLLCLSLYPGSRAAYGCCRSCAAGMSGPDPSHVSLDCPFPFDSKLTIVLVCSEFKITHNPISASYFNYQGLMSLGY